jgi:rare lipoprotein A
VAEVLARINNFLRAETMTTGLQSTKFVWGACLMACTVAVGAGTTAQTPSVPESHTETGLAAVYSDALDGRTTASGKVYDKTKLTAAHKTLPFGTKVRVTNPKTGKSVELIITDRGPVQKGRILDLSRAAAEKLGIPGSVMREVSVDVIEMGKSR